MQNEREENREKHTQYRQGNTDRYSSAPFDESELDVWTEQFNRREEARAVRNKERIRRLKRRRRRLILAMLAVIILPIAGIRLFMNSHPLILKHTVIQQELKEKLDLKSNLRFMSAKKKKQVQIEGTVDVEKEGEYSIVYKYKTYEEKATVKVSDTQAPVLTMKKSFTTDETGEVTPEDFIKKVEDASEVTCSFKDQEDWSKNGEYDVTVVAEDADGNQSTGTSKLIRKKDTTAPEITGIDATEILQGKTMNFEKGVKVKDDADPNPELTVDSSAVDTVTPGTYTVTYTAKDRSGNETTADREITVKENPDYEKKIVYLTFDDGPSENTSEILDVLKKYNAKGTFFVTGNNQEHDDLIKRAYDEGHAIGLHTYTHDYAKVYASEKAYFADLKKVSDLVEKLTGEKSYLIRFPGGSSNTVSAKYVKGLMTTLTKEVEEKGYEYFDWNCDSTDATGNNVAVSTLVANATSCSANHVTILMHDTDAKDTTVQALPKIIEYYRSQGYAFEGLTKDSIAAHHSVNN